MGLLFCLANFAVLFAEEQTRNERDLQKGIGLERFGFEKSWTFLFFGKNSNVLRERVRENSFVPQGGGFWHGLFVLRGLCEVFAG